MSELLSCAGYAANAYLAVCLVRETRDNVVIGDDGSALAPTGTRRHGPATCT